VQENENYQTQIRVMQEHEDFLNDQVEILKQRICHFERKTATISTNHQLKDSLES
jgi:hypothetical protein